MRKHLIFWVLCSILGCGGSNSGGNGGGGGGSNPGPIPNPGSGGGGSGDIVEQQQYMVFHNLKRCWHGVQYVKWNASLAASAKAHAAKCTYEKDPAVAGVYGENLAVGQGLGQIKAQDNWYMEFLSFPFGSKDGSETSRSFSQIVWKGTTDLGCGSAQCPKGTYYVCRYSPAGNVAGQYDKNVFALVPDFMKCTGF